MFYILGKLRNTVLFLAILWSFSNKLGQFRTDFVGPGTAVLKFKQDTIFYVFIDYQCVKCEYIY